MAILRSVYTGYANLDIGPYKGLNSTINDVTATRRVTDEIWSELLVLNRDNGYFSQIAKQHGNKGYRITKFRSFLDQAYDNFNNAQKISSVSASLFYYYSFLNLVKAYLVLHQPSIKIDDAIHGLIQKKNPRGFNDFIIGMQRKPSKISVFSELVKSTLSVDYPERTQFKVKDLIGYCNDISLQVSRMSISNRSTLVSKARLLVNNNEQWLVLAIPNQINELDIQNFDPAGRFTNVFEKVDIDPPHVQTGNFQQIKNFANQIFDIDGREFISFTLWQQKTPVASSNVNMQQYSDLLYRSTLGLVTEEVFNSNYDFYINKPIKDVSGRNRSMNTEIATYAIMFYLGSLVRYSPEYLTKNKKEICVLEDFVQSCPERFLRLMRNKIIQDSIRIA